MSLHEERCPGAGWGPCTCIYGAPVQEPRKPDAVLVAVAEAARAYLTSTYPDGRPYKGGDLTNAIRAWEDGQ